jgi:uncharacterized alpha/beta hydrolase family protein
MKNNKLKKLLCLIIILNILVVLTSCENSIESKKEESIKVKWKDVNFKNENSDLTYPEIYNHPNESIQSTINEKVSKIINEIKVEDEESDEITSCDYKVTYNKNSILSIRITCTHTIEGSLSNLYYYQTLNIN